MSEGVIRPMFLGGLDTMEIADLIGEPEAVVHRRLTIERELSRLGQNKTAAVVYQGQWPPLRSIALEPLALEARRTGLWKSPTHRWLAAVDNSR